VGKAFISVSVHMFYWYEV